jgi:shikimate kinase
MPEHSLNYPNIVLIGFMGSGKSSIGKALSVLLDKSFIDLDEYILKTTGAPSINSLFSYLGDSEFRILEKQNLEEVLQSNHQVIATGGGTLVCPPEPWFSLNNCTIIYLEIDFETCKKRASRNNKRPLFKDINKASELYLQRQPLYEKLAHFTVRSDGQSAKDTALKIKELLSQSTDKPD